jgi:hypothetical protein
MDGRRGTGHEKVVVEPNRIAMDATQNAEAVDESIVVVIEGVPTIVQDASEPPTRQFDGGEK